MKYLKLFLFAVTIPFAFLLIITAGFISVFSVSVIDTLHKFEGWCLNYTDHHKYIGDGIWTNKDPVVQKEQEEQKVHVYRSYPKEHYELLKELAEIFGDQWEIWYHSKHPLLNGITPYQEITYISGGLDRVKQIVNSIKNGGVV